MLASSVPRDAADEAVAAAGKMARRSDPAAAATTGRTGKPPRPVRLIATITGPADASGQELTQAYCQR